MNIFNNNQNFTIHQQNTNLNVMGNYNTIRINNSQVVVIVNGNNNTFLIQNSTVTFNINGNQNLVRAAQSMLSYGFNGNQNQIQADNQSNHRLQYCNGMGNRYPNFGENNNNQVNANRQSFQQRNNNNHSRRRQAQQSNRQPRQNNIYQFSYSEQQPPMRPRNNNFYPQFPQQNNSFNPFSMGLSGFFPNNFMEGFPQNMNNIFTNPINRNRNFQFTNHRHNYNFVFEPQQEDEVYGVQIIDVEEEQQKGLVPNELEMLPHSKHQGKDGKCTICLCEITIGEQQTFLMCFHSFHWQCIGDWLKKSGKCPLCQYDVKKHLRGQQ